MEFTENRDLKLTTEEAKDLASILFLSVRLKPYDRLSPDARRTMLGPNTDLMFKVLRQADVSGTEPPETIVVDAEHIPLLAFMGAYAVANPRETLDAFCRPNATFCESYRPDLEPAGKAALNNVVRIVTDRDGLL